MIIFAPKSSELHFSNKIEIEDEAAHNLMAAACKMLGLAVTYACVLFQDYEISTLRKREVLKQLNNILKWHLK